MKLILQNIAFLISSTFFCSCNQNFNNQILLEEGDHCFFIENNDSIKFGNINLKENLFQNSDTSLFPNIQEDLNNQLIESNILIDTIQGIYINKSLFDCFEMRDGKIIKINNAFDIVFLYPELSRYNYQVSRLTNYKVVSYFGFMFVEPSPRQNLPMVVHSVNKINDNELSIIYNEKTSLFDDSYVLDTISLKLFPKIQMKYSNTNLQSFQLHGDSSEYIKLKDEFISGINIPIPDYTFPQDVTELYLREIITKVLNLKYKTNFKTEEIIEVLD